MRVISDFIRLIRIKLNNKSLHEAKTDTLSEMSACLFIAAECCVSICTRRLARFERDTVETWVETWEAYWLKHHLLVIG